VSFSEKRRPPRIVAPQGAETIVDFFQREQLWTKGAAMNRSPPSKALAIAARGEQESVGRYSDTHIASQG
jgi:hypothetical protein